MVDHGGKIACAESVVDIDDTDAGSAGIEHGKEKRKPYRGSKAIDPSCRNHGGCPWCTENRKHKFRDKRPPEKEE